MPTNSATVIVVGSINVDLVVRVERLPRAGETVTGGVYEQRGGGKGANQAVAAARAGARVLLIGAVGDDELGEQALGELRGEGIDVSGVRRLAGSVTGVALVVVGADGENQIAVASGANAELDEPAVREALARAAVGADAVCLANFEIGDAPIVAAGRWAREVGARTIMVNPAPARPLADELVGLAPLVTPNAGEALALVGAGPDGDPVDAARKLSATIAAPVIVTLGADGAVMVSGGTQREYAAPKVRAADATGAGDAFNGALAAALAQGYDLAEAVPRAVAAATRSVQEPGARGGMVMREEIDELGGTAA